jgi:sugar lactone lactonase YvrE
LGESGTNGSPLALAVDQAGNVFEGNGNGNVYKFTPDGTRSVFAAGSIGYDRPWALTFNGAGDLLESDIPYYTYSSYFYEYAPDGTGSNYTIYAVMAAFGMAFDNAGNLFVADARNEQVFKIAPDKTWSVIATGFDLPYGVAVDNAGNVFVSDASRNTIYKIAPDGTQSVFATGLNNPTSMVFASPPGH